MKEDRWSIRLFNWVKEFSRKKSAGQKADLDLWKLSEIFVKPGLHRQMPSPRIHALFSSVALESGLDPGFLFLIEWAKWWNTISKNIVIFFLSSSSPSPSFLFPPPYPFSSFSFFLLCILSLGQNLTHAKQAPNSTPKLHPQSSVALWSLVLRGGAGRGCFLRKAASDRTMSPSRGVLGPANCCMSEPERWFLALRWHQPRCHVIAGQKGQRPRDYLSFGVQSCTQIPEPPELWENKFIACFKLQSLGAICYLRIDS